MNLLMLLIYLLLLHYYSNNKTVGEVENKIANGTDLVKKTKR